MPSRTALLTALSAVITVVLWASAFVVIRAAVPHYSPGSIALLRMAVAVVALAVVAARVHVMKPEPRPAFWPRGRNLAWIALWGFAWFTVYNVLLNAASRSMDAGTAAMIVYLAPLLVMIVAGLRFGEGFPPMLVVGALTSFSGVALIGVAGSGDPTSGVTPGSLLMGLGAAVAFAAGVIIQKPLQRRVDPFTMTFVGAAVSTLSLLPFLPQLLGELQTAPLGVTRGVIYLGLFPTAIAFTTWAFVLRQLSTGQSAAITYATPGLAVLMGWLLLGEVPTPLVLLGGALCLGGVIVGRVRPRRRPRGASTGQEVS